MSVQFATLGDLKKGSYVIIDDEPCRIVEITKAKTGKHGSAKAHVVAVSLFTGQKKTLIAPSDTQVQVPIIEKKNGQVLADLGSNLQIMDMETYDTIEVEKPTDEPELLDKLKPGVEVEYWVIMGKAKIVRTRS
ncbi:MAG: translation initiation factor IF-5A [Caldisphaera sp.]|jgi:translation initiation factor 5A|nr:translation initiation factor IF-5A [Caldisphaera sp.]PMP61155.1 MAG: translation initiation factor IF-5A [Caldisphaera sp.]